MLVSETFAFMKAFDPVYSPSVIVYQPCLVMYSIHASHELSNTCVCNRIKQNLKSSATAVSLLAWNSISCKVYNPCWRFERVKRIFFPNCYCNFWCSWTTL